MESNEIKNNKEIHPIELILADFVIYQKPNYLMKEYQELFDISSADLKNLEKYRKSISNIRYAWRKILVYKKYFSDFYPESDEKIKDFEALNHHIHAYLQDMDTLKNKVLNFLYELKKDLKKVAINKEDIEIFIKAGVDKTLESFEGVLKYRRQHVHNGMRFIDGDLLKSENARASLEMFDNPVFDSMLNQKYKPELITKIKEEEKEGFESGKERWIKMAENNNVQTTGFLKETLEIIQPSLYQFLKIESSVDILKKYNEKKNEI